MRLIPKLLALLLLAPAWAAASPPDNPALRTALDPRKGSGAIHFQTAASFPRALINKLIAAQQSNTLHELTKEELSPIQAHDEHLIETINAHVSAEEGPMRITGTRLAFSDNGGQIWYGFDGTLGRGKSYETPRYAHTDSGNGYMHSLTTLPTHEGVIATGYDASGAKKTVGGMLSAIGGRWLDREIGGFVLRAPELTYASGGDTVLMTSNRRAERLSNRYSRSLGPTIHAAPSTAQMRVFIVNDIAPVER